MKAKKIKIPDKEFTLVSGEKVHIYCSIPYIPEFLIRLSENFIIGCPVFENTKDQKDDLFLFKKIRGKFYIPIGDMNFSDKKDYTLWKINPYSFKKGHLNDQGVPRLKCMQNVHFDTTNMERRFFIRSI